MTSPTPKVVIAIRDSTGSELKTNRTEKMAMMAMDTTTRELLLNVMSTSIRPVVPMTPTSVIDQRLDSYSFALTVQES